MKTEINGYDTPEKFSPSSVGALEYPPEAATENRKKGIYPEVIETSSDLNNLVKDFSLFPFDAQTSRFSVRYFVNNLSLEQTDREIITPFLEAVIPLTGTLPELEDCSLIYLGKNTPERQSDPQVFTEEIQRAIQIFSDPPKKKKISVNNDIIYQVQLLNQEMCMDADLQAQYAELYSAFGWDPKQVVKMLVNPNNILVAAFNQDRELMSSVMAEKAVLTPTRNQQTLNFIMHEVTEAATKEKYRGCGIYKNISRILVQEILPKTHLIYGELNLQAPGVQIAARDNGRKSSLSVLQQLGFPPNALRQHVRIHGGKDDQRPLSSKNDLLPVFGSRNQLKNYFENEN